MALVPPPADGNGTFHDYTRVFAGRGSPIIDKSFTAISIPGTNLSAHYNYSSSQEYHNHVSLSVGLFDAKFHGIGVTRRIIKVINKTVGREGLFDKRY